MWNDQSFDLNVTSDQADRPADHTRHYAVVRSRALIDQQQLYIEMRDFVHFDRHHNDIAVVYGKHDVDGVCYALFDTGHLFGWASSWINPRVVPVRISCDPAARLAVGDTAGHHMLAGQRRWWVELFNSDVRLVTEAYERPRNRWNRIGMFVGRYVQMKIWAAYLRNICEAHQLEAIYDADGPRRVAKTPASWWPQLPYPGCDCKI